jgi:hypothetical protein
MASGHYVKQNDCGLFEYIIGVFFLGEHENFLKTTAIRIRNLENTKQGRLPY